VTCSYPYEPYSWDLQSQRLGYHHLFVSSGPSLIPLDVSITIFHPRILSEGLLDSILTSHTQWKLLHSSVDTTDWQSQCIFIPSGMLAEKFINYSASLSTFQEQHTHISYWSNNNCLSGWSPWTQPNPSVNLLPLIDLSCLNQRFS